MRRLIRNILLLAILAIVILAGALAFNTFTHGSRQLQVAAVPRAAVDAQAAAGRLSEAIRFRTVSSFEKPDQHAGEDQDGGDQEQQDVADDLDGPTHAIS